MLIANFPYFSITGGDVAVGAGMTAETPTGGTTCTAEDNKAGVVSWNQEATGNYAGAGTQYAALALDYLQDFATAQNSNLAPSGLAFANTDPNYVQPPDLFGGNFGNFMGCMRDYFKDHPTTQTPVHNITQNSGDIGKTIYMQGNMKVGSLSIPNNSQTTVYVDGDVYITGSGIKFTDAYASVAAIPSFDLIVKGNIYIAPGVGQIDGLYVAEPNVSGNGTPSDGVTYTCAATPYKTSTTSPTDAQTYLTSNLYTQCRATPLTVNGSLVARQVWLLRASGSLSSNNAAENVNFSPEVWLNAPPEPGTDTYDAITSLPPVL